MNMITTQTPVANIRGSGFSEARPTQPPWRHLIAARKKSNAPVSVCVLFQRAARVMLWAALLLSAMHPSPSEAIIANPDPVELTQPDGSKITLRLRGDEWFNWLEDLQGYTVVIEQGKYVYATLNTQGLLAPTGLAVGQADPGTAGLTKGLLPSSQIRSQLREALPVRREIPSDRLGKIAA